MNTILYILVILSFTSNVMALNYFWLSWDPDESAKWYCDQHCFKIGSEVIESIWDSVLVLCPDLAREADELGFTKATRKRRHSKPGTLWHPLSVWHGLCRSNMIRGLVNANAIFKEHERRTGTRHVAWLDCLFLLRNISRIDFNSKIWSEWYATQNPGHHMSGLGKIGKNLIKRREWCKIHARNILNIDRCAGGEITEPPRLVGDLDTKKDLIVVYREYYMSKLYTMGVMRYYHFRPPPPWISGRKIVTDDGKLKIVPYDSDV
jgi:hypothetical protein